MEYLLHFYHQTQLVAIDPVRQGLVELVEPVSSPL